MKQLQMQAKYAKEAVPQHVSNLAGLSKWVQITCLHIQGQADVHHPHPWGGIRQAKPLPMKRKKYKKKSIRFLLLKKSQHPISQYPISQPNILFPNTDQLNASGKFTSKEPSSPTYQYSFKRQHINVNTSDIYVLTFMWWCLCAVSWRKSAPAHSQHKPIHSGSEIHLFTER